MYENKVKIWLKLALKTLEWRQKRRSSVDESYLCIYHLFDVFTLGKLDSNFKSLFWWEQLQFDYQGRDIFFSD